MSRSFGATFFTTPAASHVGTRPTLKSLGYTNARAKNVVLYDEPVSAGVGSMAQIYADDRLASANRSLRGGMFAVVYSLTWKTLMRELTHAMGAVQYTAPHTTKAYHCTDGYDVMCYKDNGSEAYRYTASACPSASVFDCNKDDYFNTKPAAGNYLATHWNLGSKLNTYIRFAPAEDRTAPVITTSEPKSGPFTRRVAPSARRPRTAGRSSGAPRVASRQASLTTAAVSTASRSISTDGSSRRSGSSRWPR